MIKVSIIVPVYNMEKYLDVCLTSLIKQKMNDIEFLIINDGSTDNSEKIVKKYVKKDKRIKLYLKLPNPDTSENNIINLSDNPMIIGKVFLRKDIESTDGIEITIKDWETFWDELRMKYKKCC